MYADYDFYKNTYKGIVIADANSYEYFAERASDELALFSHKEVFANDEDEAMEKAQCLDGTIYVNKSQEDIGALIEVTDVKFNN